MSFGFQREPQGYANDTVVLDAYLYSADGTIPIPLEDITSVTFTIVGPSASPDDPSVSNAAGLVIEDGHGQYVVDASVNDGEGNYKAIAQFIYNEDDNFGLVKTVPCNYSIIDAFVGTGPSPADAAVREAWMFIEDCFDSEVGGPWLRDMTLANFDQSKMRQFIPQVLLTINNQMPFTTYTETSFPWVGGDGQALFALGLLVQIERHLMRSYTEQPLESGAPVLWQDRTRYQQAWKAMYDVDYAEFKHWLNRWKLQSYDLSRGSLLIGSKAGRMLPAPMRSRNAGFGYF